MLSYFPAAVCLAGALVILGMACSKQDNEQQPAVETAGSAPAASLPADSMARDTTAGQVAAPSARKDTAETAALPAQADTAAAAKPTKPPVRPSIDPGRKAPTKSPKLPTTARADTASRSDSAASPAQQTQSQQDQSGEASSQQNQWLKYDAGSKTVTFELIAGPFNWNGYGSGGATLTIPANANVVMNFVNKDGTPHSAEIISGEGPLPNQPVDAAIPRAYTNQLLQGLPQEATDVMRFTAPASGTYRIFCGVPGHGLSGMWIWMKIDPAAKSPSFGPTKS